MIEGLLEAFEVMKAMQAEGLEWGEGYCLGLLGSSWDRPRPDGRERRPLARQHLPLSLSERVGDVAVPRICYCLTAVLKSYARRSPEIDWAILASFVLEPPTRKIGEVMLAPLGRPISAAIVSRVAKTLGEAVAAFHRCPLANRYKALMLGGVVLGNRVGAVKRPVLVTFSLCPDGKKEIIDHQLPRVESTIEWKRFLTSLYRRGPTGDASEMICGGGQGVFVTLPAVYHGIPVQRCWAHKIQKHAQQSASGRSRSRQAGSPCNHERPQPVRKNFADRWNDRYPKVVKCLRDELDDLLACFRYGVLAERKQVRTTNAATVLRGSAANSANGRLPDLDGSHSVCHCRPRKQTLENRYLFSLGHLDVTVLTRAYLFPR